MKRTVLIDERFPLPARKLLPLVQQILKLSQHQAEQVIHAGSIRVNGRVAARTQLILQIGDNLEAEYDDDAFRTVSRAFPPDRVQVPEIVYQDEHLVVVHKPPAMLTVPTKNREPNTLIAHLEKRLQREKSARQLYCVHRLDRGVSGLLVFAKTLEVAERIRSQFEARKPQRRYVAIVAGVLAEDSGTFRSYLATDAQLNRFSTTDASRGQLAITHYHVTRRLSDLTLVEVRLETGRRNQIRVHFSEAGHPILGDDRYGGRLPTFARRWPHQRIALHAISLGILHPVSGESLEFESPLPLEMAALDRPVPRNRQAHQPDRKKKR